MNREHFENLVERFLNQIHYNKGDREKIKLNLVNSIIQNRKTMSNKTNIKDLIKEKAKEITEWYESKDKLIWLWAESELELRQGKRPEYSQIKKLAEKFSKKEENVDKIRWYLAENYLMLDKL